MKCVAFYSGSLNSGLQTRTTQASLPSNEKLFLMRLLTTRGDLVSARERAKQKLLLFDWLIQAEIGTLIYVLSVWLK